MTSRVRHISFFFSLSLDRREGTCHNIRRVVLLTGWWQLITSSGICFTMPLNSQSPDGRGPRRYFKVICSISEELGGSQEMGPRQRSPMDGGEWDHHESVSQKLPADVIIWSRS